MAKNPETRLVKKILDALEKEGGVWYKIVANEFQEPGIPDIVGSYRGRFVAFEVKMPTGSLRPIQRYQINRLTREGRAVVAVVTTVDEALSVLRNLPEESDT